MEATKQMTPMDALQVLARATEPGVRITRTDYVAIDHALCLIRDALTVPPAPAADPSSA